MEPFIYQKSKMPIFSLERWQDEFPQLKVGFSARLSEEVDWNDSNYAFHVGTQPHRVIQVRKQLMDQLQIPFATWTCGEQIHGSHIEQVMRADRGKGQMDRQTGFADTDGLLTCDPDVFLASFYADCVPLFFYSPDIDLIGVAHAGWKGTVRGIGQKMVDHMSRLGAARDQIRVAIAPAIGPCCYTVDQRVIDPLKQILSSFPDDHDIFDQIDQNEFRLDLKEANRQILLQSGILPEHISQSKWCTSCHPTYFHSHRRDERDTGRMVAWIVRRSEG